MSYYFNSLHFFLFSELKRTPLQKFTLIKMEPLNVKVGVDHGFCPRGNSPGCSDHIAIDVCVKGEVTQERFSISSECPSHVIHVEVSVRKETKESEEESEQRLKETGQKIEKKTEKEIRQEIEKESDEEIELELGLDSKLESDSELESELESDSDSDEAVAYLGKFPGGAKPSGRGAKILKSKLFHL